MSYDGNLLDLKGSADVTTHVLNERGGSLFEGVVKIANESFGKGRMQGIIVTSGTFAIILGAIYLCKKNLDKIQVEGEFISNYFKDFSKEDVMKCVIDTEFPWDEIKGKLKDRTEITNESYDIWIKPLVCIAYDDRVLIEVCDEKISCDFIANKYKQIIQECIYEVTGKAYIVSIVRPGEIVIEDMVG